MVMSLSYRHLLVAALLTVSIAGTAWGAGAIFYEVGTPDLGSANAGRAALAQEASTAYGNPAGMTRLDRSQLLLGIQQAILSARFDIEPETTDPATPGTDQGTDGGDAGGSFPGGALYYVQDLDEVVEGLRTGLTLNSFMALAIDYEDDWVGRYFVQEVGILTFNISPVVAYRINENISFGGGANILYGKLNVKVAINNVLDGVPDGRLEADSDTWGFGGNAGILFELGEDTRFGVTYRSPIDLDFEDIAEINNLGPLLRALLAARGLTNAELDLDITIPQELMGSLYHEITDKWAVMFNTGWQNWQDFGNVDVTVRAVDTTDLTADLRFKDTWHVALGTQYELAEAWLLSAGFAFDSSPVSDNDRSATLPMDQQIRLGLGLQHDISENVVLGAAYEYMDAGRNKIDQEGGPLTGRLDGHFEPFVTQFFNVTLDWKF
jgi:long-chain fatty acid transport protein